MSAKITRFYFDFDEDCRTGCLLELAFEDIDNADVKEYEQKLKEKDVQYIKIPL